MRRSTPLLVVLLAAVALAPAFAAPRPHAGDEAGVGGWGARAPAWQDPGGRATGSLGGDAPRSLPPAKGSVRYGCATRGSALAPATDRGARRPSLTALGKRQADGG